MSIALSKSEGGSALDVNLKMPSEAWLLVSSSCGLTSNAFSLSEQF